MCEFCTKHGEGKKWYLNVKNYSLDLLSDLKRRGYVENIFYNLHKKEKDGYELVKKLPHKLPVIGTVIKKLIKIRCQHVHWGQVIPIEDIEKVFSITNSITRVPCMCNKALHDKETRKCFGICIDPKVVDMVDQSYLGGSDMAGFEQMSKEEALNFMRECELNGRFHSIWTMKTPFIGGLCNCDKEGCMAMKMFSEVTPVFFKSEYILKVNKDICDGCGECIKLCPFDALEMDLKDRKIKIDKEKCAGCGICRSVCRNNALFLEPRIGDPEVMDLW